ncbi:MAG: aminotransferase class V-fold PLP-dependent enzyme [Gemmatimonadota bacterium]|nr:aminotransferase class V-fold PLP-dependent enzyme [Gemmatimonadota bacterium]MDE2873211.1 aminotransferase class V-fold PLP-dependent enzyme [Gemmatimonadota bacterium]
MTAGDGAPLTCQRHRFSLPEDFHYLNCAYMGPLPKAAERAGIEGLRAKRFPQAIAPEDFFRPADELRARFARLINAPDPNRVAMVPSVSYAVSTIARNTEAGPGRNVVIVHEQFPGNVYPWRRLVEEKGGELRVAAPAGGGVRGEGWTERILGQIDGATVAVAMGTVHWSDGTRFDLEAVRARSRAVGAALILDGTQTVGAAPFDVRALAPDALIVAAYKWLLGPYSLSLAWFGERYLDGIPLEETWIGRRGSEDFAGLVDYRDAYQSGALRFDVGQRSNFALIPALAASLDLVLTWRPERVSAYCAALMAGVFPRLRELGLGVEDERWRCPHIFGLGLPPRMNPDRLKRSLERHRVGVSFRGTGVRVSPCVYNTEEDVEALVAAFTGALDD